MITGTTSAQLISMGLSPIITRLYGPEAFGIMGTFNSMVSIILPIVALTYPYAIVLPKNIVEALGIVKLSIYITVSFSTIILVFIYIFQDLIVTTFNLYEISPYLFLIPVA